MADYNSLKVPDLKKILSERGLVQSGKKDELIARLQEDDKKAGAGAGEDEIDWDDEDKTTTAPAPTEAPIPAASTVPVETPVTGPNQKIDTDPSKTTDLKVTGGADAPIAADGVVASSGKTTAEPAAEPEKPKVDFSIGLGQTDAEKEAAKREARAKRFNITKPEAESEEAKKLAERAKKFGIEAEKNPIIKGLDSALPERKAKRGREGKEGGERAVKRQTPDRRAEPKAKATAHAAKKTTSKILDNPEEKAKAEARAKRFATGKTAA